MRLRGEEEAQPAETGEGEARVPARETPPAVMEAVVVCFCTNLDRSQFVSRRGEIGGAAGEEVRSRSADGVLEEVGEEKGHDD